MVELEDFRQYQSKFNANKVIVDKKYNDTQGIVVHMGAKSQHMGSNSNGIYQSVITIKQTRLLFTMMLYMIMKSIATFCRQM